MSEATTHDEKKCTKTSTWPNFTPAHMRLRVVKVVVLKAKKNKDPKAVSLTHTDWNTEVQGVAKNAAIIELEDTQPPDSAFDWIFSHM